MNKGRFTERLFALLIIIALLFLPGCKPITLTLTTTELATTTSVKTTTAANSTVTVTEKVTVTPTLTVTETLDVISPTTTTTQTYDPYSHYHGYLLEGYPEDIWPLYGSLAIVSCAFMIQYPVYNNIGYYQNRYSVIYVTDKSKAQIAEYYGSLLDTKEEHSFFDAVGTVKGYYVDAYWDDFMGYGEVYLTVSLPEGSGLTSNPFHTDFPEVMQNYYNPNEWWGEDHACMSNPPNGTLWYIKMFSFNGTNQEALAYYRALYGDAESYKETVTENYYGEETTISGYIGEVRFAITVGWGAAGLINIFCEIPQK
ncbi:MAG: hypothetical protein WC958_01935 [Dehalococcoidales bacterium]